MSSNSESQPPSRSIPSLQASNAPVPDAGSIASGPVTLTLSEAQDAVDAWIKQYGVRYFSELTNLGQLMEEVGELARIMTRRFGDQSCKPGDAAGEIADELADILFVVLCLANQTGVNLTDALSANLSKKTNRDQHRHRGNPKLRSQRPV